jgi:hypothetical protein
MTSVTVGDDASAAGDGDDLLVIALSGVQRFIAESRTTADLRAGSEIFARLAAQAARVIEDAGGARLVFPQRVPATPDRMDGVAAVASEAVGVPNRIVALVPAGRGARLAGEVAAAVDRLWRDWVRATVGGEVDTPGLPSVQWVRVPASGQGGYAAQWHEAQSVLVGRRRLRDFAEVEVLGERLCALSPRWTALPSAPLPSRAYERDVLSAANWVKRRWRGGVPADGGDRTDGERVGFPSTSSIASALFRQRVLRAMGERPVREAVTALRVAVWGLTRTRETAVAGLLQERPGDDLARWFAEAGGPWVYPEVWDAASLWRELGERRRPMPDVFPTRATAGRVALDGLLRLMDPQGKASAPPSYLALIAQDLDDMGAFLGGQRPAANGAVLAVDAAEHGRVSARLLQLADQQRQALIVAGILGVPVYAGGDDLLAFAPAPTGLAAARGCRSLVPDDLRTASTAVLFFHRTSSLRRAVTEAWALLAQAKTVDERKDALGVGFLRRSGVREYSIQPWHLAGHGDDSAADLFAVFGKRPHRRPLSPRLVSELERDEAELAGLDPFDDEADLYRAELSRLVQRHGGTSADASALGLLGRRERARREADTAVRGQYPVAASGVPARAARVAVFLRQECAQLGDGVR